MLIAMVRRARSSWNVKLATEWLAKEMLDLRGALRQRAENWITERLL